VSGVPLRLLLEPNPETINELVLAAEERYWDAYELAVQGRAFAAIYFAGFAAEMLLKVAGFRFDGALPGDPIQPRLGPAKTYGSIQFPTIPHESYHSLRFWRAFLEHKRIDAGRPLGGALLAERVLPPRTGELEQRLAREFAAPSDDPHAQPIIIAEPPGEGPITRLFVIWDEWALLSQQDRSEIIMDAYVHAKGQAEALRISVAMGLTAAEAARMGIT
jgi:hypothetical protein